MEYPYQQSILFTPLLIWSACSVFMFSLGGRGEVNEKESGNGVVKIRPGTFYKLNELTSDNYPLFMTSQEHPPSSPD